MSNEWTTNESPIPGWRVELDAHDYNENHKKDWRTWYAPTVGRCLNLPQSVVPKFSETMFYGGQASILAITPMIKCWYHEVKLKEGENPTSTRCRSSWSRSAILTPGSKKKKSHLCHTDVVSSSGRNYSNFIVKLSKCVAIKRKVADILSSVNQNVLNCNLSLLGCPTLCWSVDSLFSICIDCLFTNIALNSSIAQHRLQLIGAVPGIVTRNTNYFVRIHNMNIWYHLFPIIRGS